MPTTVILNDFKHGLRYYLVFKEEHFARIRSAWTSPDRLICDLAQQVAIFKSRETWESLLPRHYHFLVQRTLLLLDNFPVEERYNETNDIVRSLHTIIMALIFCLESHGDTSVELLKIMRYNNDAVIFDYHASISSCAPETDGVTGSPPPLSRPKMKIVLDNTQGTTDE